MLHYTCNNYFSWPPRGALDLGGAGGWPWPGQAQVWTPLLAAETGAFDRQWRASILNRTLCQVAPSITELGGNQDWEGRVARSRFCQKKQEPASAKGRWGPSVVLTRDTSCFRHPFLRDVGMLAIQWTKISPGPAPSTKLRELYLVSSGSKDPPAWSNR
jgi:hypothetical protein